MGIIPPIPLTENHRLHDFDCGQPSLNDWLQRRALPNQQSGASRSFVACDDANVVGYYALASGAVVPAITSGKFRRNMPDPIPVVILARLAVAQSYQGSGLGRGLFRDASLRVLQAADSIGIRGMVTHALTEEARNFYLRLGFDPSPLEPMTLLITLNDLRACVK